MFQRRGGELIISEVQGEQKRELTPETVAYILESRVAFDACRDALGQIAGLMILVAAGSRDWRERGLLSLAVERLNTVTESISDVRPTVAGRHHHGHLSDCAALLHEACASASAAMDVRGEAVSILALLRAASRHLQACSVALPGFPVVTLEGCCCGNHPLRRSA